jgi:hypothetical protein
MNYSLATSLLTTLWAGLVLGISFIAQPAKFATPQLPKPIALAAGRQMFRAMHLAEGALAVSAIVLLMLAGSPRLWPIFGAVLMLLLQIFVLMPPLSDRVDARLAGRELPGSGWHGAFAVTEVAKFGLLLAASVSPLFTTGAQPY